MTDTNRDGNIRQNRGEAASSHTHPTMVESSGKRRKRYVDFLLGESKSCFIHVPMYSSDKCKVMGNFDSNFVKVDHTKDHRNITVPKNRLNWQH